MRAELISFPKPKRNPIPRAKPRRRVFYVGHKYVGPAFCQVGQHIYLKRHAHAEWSLIFYYQGRAWEIERFDGNDMLSKLDAHQIEDTPDIESLEAMGWQNPEPRNVEDFELHYYQRYPERFCAYCFERLPHEHPEGHECLI